MGFRGSDFFDDDCIFQNYMARREGQENANDTLEKPLIREMMGDVSGLSVLDLGCGDARFGIELLEAGCADYLGVEGSHNMVEAAAGNLHGYPAKVVHSTIEDWPFPAGRFDLVLSRLVLHYIEDLDSLYCRIHQALKPGGRLLFSVEHPVITSTLQTAGQRTNWLVDQYFVNGPRQQHWMGGTVSKYHRTIEDYFLGLQKAGFTVEQLRESRPLRENFLHQETYERRMRIPLFLLLSGRK
ncbi:MULTISPECIES: class I SAM-dependent methyltransferase [Brevibacillus]|uniref:Type 11 methyltransferase n=1 Tax=Brevibacillus borstelensis AK1 TaxID=1300222 RepID=M8E5E9_9BACL|nr:class I SAM-dependent methyltransferase [Brevibacillus borstelensis]EMT50685.1 type 11 methyltransferase [Brevibacillus borstelensis AK1]MCC0564536.1 class I SAM-dependent methyltransferase [Brevibacillus borstelensis]MCM3470448.1 class I SAM-dependent methyltransferase [Brevibacillus borstelensis]MCM3592057.1 class I SAM-dependent methyltransferase [Brevibacillus borstelensis]MED1744562.1 class I SAM-dependent methyltransferase [Brevibacillus borstelensis]